MFQRPTEVDLRKPKMWNGRQWWYCHKDTGGKCGGVHRVHKPQESRGSGLRKSPSSDKSHRSDKPHSNTDKNQSRSLKLTHAMSTIIHSDGSGTVSQTSDYEE